MAETKDPGRNKEKDKNEGSVMFTTGLYEEPELQMAPIA